MLAFIRQRHNIVIRQWLALSILGEPRYARKGN